MMVLEMGKLAADSVARLDKRIRPEPGIRALLLTDRDRAFVYAIGASINALASLKESMSKLDQAPGPHAGSQSAYALRYTSSIDLEQLDRLEAEIRRRFCISDDKPLTIQNSERSIERHDQECL